jgi:hypothetical protein
MTALKMPNAATNRVIEDAEPDLPERIVKIWGTGQRNQEAAAPNDCGRS